MSESVVDRLYVEFSTLTTYLEEGREISLRNVADDTLRKALLLAASSHFEHRLCDAVMEFVGEVSGRRAIAELVRRKAVSRQYHTWFNWEGNNANSFFGLFGERFAARMKEKVAGEGVLKAGIEAFLEIGRERNRMVHDDFGNFTLEKTTEEVYRLYEVANTFVEAFPDCIRSLSD